MSTVFHTTPPPWLPDVEGMRPGQKRRIGDGYLASFNGRAYMRWDFREKEAEVYEPQMSLAEKLEMSRLQREADSSAAQSTLLPERMLHPRDWPVDARVWLHKASLDNEDIRILGAGWAAQMQRVVIPLKMLDGTTQWIGRRTDNTRDVPKYLFPAGMQRGGGAFVRGWGVREGEPVVITEDILSAYRVAKDSDLDAVSALGTSLDRDAIVRISKDYAAAIVWLDPDFYGQQGARRIASDLRQLGVHVTNIVSDRDPKNHSSDDIRRYIQGPPVSLEV